MVANHIETQVGFPHRSSSASALSRRGFLRAAAAAGGGLMLSLRVPLAGGDAAAADAFAPNAFIRIATDGKVTLIMPYVEMGQGTYTSIPMLIAEELEIDLKQVQLEHAPPDEKFYANPLLGVQATGLLSAGAEQLALLHGERWSDVERTIDRIEERFGRGAAQPASLLDRDRRH